MLLLGSQALWDCGGFAGSAPASESLHPTLFLAPAGTAKEFSSVPDSSWFVTGGVGAAEIRETATGSLRHRLPFDGLIVHLDVSRDGRRIVACGEFGEACVWDAQSRPTRHPTYSQPRRVITAFFSPDGRWFCLLISDSTARVYETRNGPASRARHDQLFTDRQRPFSRANGRRLITATVSGRLEFWSLPEGIRMDPEFRQQRCYLDHSFQS
jgi:WD40 repeat protein